MTAQAHLDVRDGIAHLTFQGRSDLNLLGRQAFSALEDALEQVSGDPRVRAVVLRGAGQRAFSAGVDLHEMKTLVPLEAESFIQALHRVARRVLTLPQPVIAAVRGPCLGGAHWSWPWPATSASPPRTPSSACPRSGWAFPR